MIRSHKNTNLAWSKKPANPTGKEIYEYDYLETYWMVDEDLYYKDVDSTCTVSHNEKGKRIFQTVKCTHWHFYLCEKLGRRPTKPMNLKINRAPRSKWDESEQPRIYPLTKYLFYYLCVIWEYIYIFL